MRILFCTSFYTNTHNGAGQFARHIELLNTFFPKHEIRILSQDIDSEIAQTNEKYYSLKIKPKGLLEAFGMISLARDYHDAAVRIKKTFDFDILFFNNAFASIKSLHHFSDSVRVMAFIHDDNYMHYSLSNFTFSKRWLYRYIHYRYERRICQQLDLVLTNSMYMKNEIQKQYKISPEKVAQVYVSIDTDQITYHPPRTIALNTPIKILFIKNQYKRGGLQDLTKALERLAADYSFEITVIGPFQSELPAIQLLFNTPKVQLKFLGNISQAEVFETMQTHDVLCVPARSEAQGVVNLEGLAVGIPVVTTSVGGIPEITDQGKNAWLCPPNNPEALSQVLQQCLEQHELRAQKSKAGRKHVKEKFHFKKMLAKIDAIFN